MRPGSSESLNRRSWDSSKLASQIEEEPNEFLDVPISKLDTLSLKSNLPPASPKKEEKEGMFSKFKHFRKGKLQMVTLFPIVYSCYEKK